MAVSCSRPVGLPRSSRSITPPTGGAVSRAVAARSSAALFDGANVSAGAGQHHRPRRRRHNRIVARRRPAFARRRLVEARPSSQRSRAAGASRTVSTNPPGSSAAAGRASTSTDGRFSRLRVRVVESGNERPAAEIDPPGRRVCGVEIGGRPTQRCVRRGRRPLRRTRAAPRQDNGVVKEADRTRYGRRRGRESIEHVSIARPTTRAPPGACPP